MNRILHLLHSLTPQNSEQNHSLLTRHIHYPYIDQLWPDSTAALVLLVLDVFISVAMAHSCYWVSCGTSSCVHVEAVFSDGLNSWYKSRKGGYQIEGIAAGYRAVFRTLCTRHRAMGDICD